MTQSAVIDMAFPESSNAAEVLDKELQAFLEAVEKNRDAAWIADALTRLGAIEARRPWICLFGTCTLPGDPHS